MIKVRIVENSNNMVATLKMKLKKFMSELSPEERGLMASSFGKPSISKLLNWCGDAKDKIDGKDDDEALKILQFKAKQKKQTK